LSHFTAWLLVRIVENREEQRVEMYGFVLGSDSLRDIAKKVGLRKPRGDLALKCGYLL